MEIRKCPVCKIEMKELEIREVVVDRCPKCLGIWLDEGELSKIVQRRKKFYEKIQKRWPPQWPGEVVSEPMYDEELEAIIGED